MRDIKTPVSEKAFTQIADESRSKSKKARAVIRNRLIQAATGTERNALLKALDGYGQSDEEGVCTAFSDFIVELLQSYAATELIDSGVIDYAKDVSAERVLELKDELTAEFPETAIVIEKRIITFEDILKLTRNNYICWHLVNNLDWLDIVKALKFASKDIQNEFFRIFKLNLTPILKRQMAELSVSKDESIEAQRRITRVLYLYKNNM